MRTQINNKKTKKIITAALYTMIIAGAAGAATGTYAWYSYQKNVNVDFKGTSIKTGDEIEVGLRYAGTELTAFEAKYEKDIDAGQIEITTATVGTATETIYWVKGNYLQNVLMDFLKMTGYSDNYFVPVTSGTWTSENYTTWSGLKKNPGEGNGAEAAEKTDYIKLPLAFKIGTQQADGSLSYNNPGKNIYLTKFVTEDINDTNNAELSKALRVKVDYPTVTDHSKDFIFDPNNSSAKDLKVGGVLNLNRDVYYDYKYDVITNKYTEVAYGEFEGDKYTSNVEANDPTIVLDDCTTFNANHLKGVTLVNTDNAKKCETKANTAAISAATNEGTPIVTTEAGSALGFVDFTVYLEGWDSHIVDLAQGCTFTISFEFSIQ